MVVLFFGTWSEQARKHIEEASKLAVAYRDSGLTVLGITAETDSSAVREFASKNKVEFPLLLGGGEVLQNYEVGGVPDTYCVTRYGLVCERLVGFSPELEQTLEEVVKLMVKKMGDGAR